MRKIKSPGQFSQDLSKISDLALCMLCRLSDHSLLFLPQGIEPLLHSLPGRKEIHLDLMVAIKLERSYLEENLEAPVGEIEVSVMLERHLVGLPFASLPSILRGFYSREFLHLSIKRFFYRNHLVPHQDAEYNRLHFYQGQTISRYCFLAPWLSRI